MFIRFSGEIGLIGIAEFNRFPGKNRLVCGVHHLDSIVGLAKGGFRARYLAGNGRREVAENGIVKRVCMQHAFHKQPVGRRNAGTGDIQGTVIEVRTDCFLCPVLFARKVRPARNLPEKRPRPGTTESSGSGTLPFSRQGISAPTGRNAGNKAVSSLPARYVA